MTVRQAIALPVTRPVAVPVHELRTGKALYGPELITAGAWTYGGSSNGSDNGANVITVVNGTNAGTAGRAVTLEDNTTYRVAYSAVITGGGFKTQTYGATTAHLGGGLTRTTSGDYVETVTTSGAGSLTNTFRFQLTGTTTSNNFVISNISLRKVLP